MFNAISATFSRASHGPHDSRSSGPVPASSSATPAAGDSARSRTKASPTQRATAILVRTVRQFPVACLNVAFNYGFQAAALNLSKNAKARDVLPWVSLAGHSGVSISKEVFGELAELIGPRLTLPGGDSRLWPYSTQSMIATLVGAIADAGFYTLGVKIGTEAGNKIIIAHGGGNEIGADKAQALLKLLQDFRNGELFAFLGPNGACDLAHRATEAVVLAFMPDAEFDFKFCRKPEWRKFFVRMGIGFGVRVAVTGLCSSGWLKAIASESQAGYMVAGPRSALVPAVLRVAQPFIRDALYRTYIALSEPRAGNPATDSEAASAALPPAETTTQGGGDGTGDATASQPGAADRAAEEVGGPIDTEQTAHL
ncbi:MAG: hypothetical protein V7642_6442 [Burkholderiales bacterium]